ncbi:MAG TPA: flagellar biosynthesis protein FlgJ [Treponema sp.]|nr:flagellar biosynthesis protein FlgJ [Treponema sp.]
MDIQNIHGYSTTNFLTDGKASSQAAKSNAEQQSFLDLVASMQAKASAKRSESNAPTVASSQISSTHRLNGDYTQGFGGTYTSEKDKTASPRGFAANSSSGKGGRPVIDRTSELYEQSMELENYMVKMMLSSARKTVQKSSLLGGENDYAQEMYEDMLYDNYAEQLTKNAGFGLADAIYIELSGQRG